MTGTVEASSRAVRRQGRSGAPWVVLVLVLCGGCRYCGGAPSHAVGDNAGGDTGGGTEGGPCRPWVLGDEAPGGDPSKSALFVVTKLRFGADGQGMNLDCVETPGQCRDDVCRDGPDDGPSGVDNRLGPLALKLSTLVGSDLQAEMAKQIEAGRHPLLVRVTGATDWRDGGGTAVELSFGLDVDDDPSDLASGQGRVRYDPEPASRPSRFVPVGLAGGVLRAGPTTDWMPLFWTRGQIAAVPVQRAFLKGMVETPPRGEPALAGRLVSGMIAGAVHATHLAQAILDMDARTARVLRGLAPVVRALVRQQADLDLVPAGLTDRPCRENGDCLSGQRCQAQRCHEPLHHYDSISFALLFEAVSAQAVHPPAS